jgi:predicted acylesterase/phospholipase RssA
MPNVVFPNRQRGYLQQMGREAFGDMRAPQVRATGVRLPSLRHPIPETKVFRGDEYDLADMAALSSAIPLGFHPVEVDGENYVDGGARSLVHAHRAPAADNLLVIAPLARHFNPKLKGVKLHAGRALEIMTLREMEQWETEHGGLASLIRPSREIGGLVEKFSDIFSRKVARKAHDLAVKQGEQLATNRHTLATLAFRMSLPERDAS